MYGGISSGFRPSRILAANADGLSAPIATDVAASCSCRATATASPRGRFGGWDTSTSAPRDMTNLSIDSTGSSASRVAVKAMMNGVPPKRDLAPNLRTLLCKILNVHHAMRTDLGKQDERGLRGYGRALNARRGQYNRGKYSARLFAQGAHVGAHLKCCHTFCCKCNAIST